MQVEMSLAEMLINAITHGRVPGVQFKRGWSDEKATFGGLKEVIGSRLDSARRVAVESALRELRDEHPHFKVRAERDGLLVQLREVQNHYELACASERESTDDLVKANLEIHRLRAALVALTTYVETLPYQAGVLPLENARAALSESEER